MHELSPLTWVNLTDIRKPSIGTTRVAYSLPLPPKQTARFVKLSHFSVKRLNKLNQFDVNGVGDLVEIDPIIFHLLLTSICLRNLAYLYSQVESRTKLIQISIV